MDRNGSPSAKVIRQTAEREGVDPAELSEVLAESIDPDALDSLFANSEGVVEFEYHGYLVTVESEGNVRLGLKSKD